MRDDVKAEISKIKIWAKENLVGKYISSEIGNISITWAGLKETINQPHQFPIEKLRAIYLLQEIIPMAEFVKMSEDKKTRPFRWHYLKIDIENKDSFLVIRENVFSSEKILYSIVDNIK
jgi:hypothetical protein